MEESEADTTAEDIEPAGGERRRVLLVEDAQSLGRLFTDALTRADLDVEWVTDAEEAVLSLRANPPSLLVLDDRMPGRGASEILAELKHEDEDRMTVLVLSTRADREAGTFAALGARECLSKPFPPKALVQRCRALLSEDGATSSDGDTSPFVVIAELEDEESGRTPHPVIALVGGALRRVLEDRLGAMQGASLTPEGEETVRKAAADIARSVFEDERMVAVLPGANGVLHGDLSAVSLVQVVQLLAAEQQSGVLEVESGVDRAEFVFSDGRIDLGVLPPGDDRDLLVRVLATAALFDHQTAKRKVARLPKGHAVVAEAIDTGLVKMGDLRRAIGEATRRALFDALRWRRGRFAFGPRERLSSLATDVGLSLGVDELLMEGARRIDEWHVIEKRLPDPSAVFVREEQRLTPAVVASLTSEEQEVLDLVDGRSSLGQLVERSDMPSYDVHSLLHRLLTLRMVRPRTRPVVTD